jgi:hypothetical protein
MHLLFIDESGTPPKPDKDHPRYFVLGGAIIPESSWGAVRDALHGLKIQHRLRGELKWRYFSPDNDDEKNPMRRLTPPERNQTRERIYQIISGKHGITTIAAICSAKAAYTMPNINSPDDLYHLTYKVLTERFQHYLQDSTKANEAKQNGLIIGDHRGAQDDKRLRAHHQMLVHSNARTTTRYTHLIESLILQPSHESVGIQLADMVAGAVWRRYERADSTYYDMLAPSMRTSRTGTVEGYGIVKVPKHGWI